MNRVKRGLLAGVQTGIYTLALGFIAFGSASQSTTAKPAVGGEIIGIGQGYVSPAAPGQGGELVFEQEGKDVLQLALSSHVDLKVSAFVSRVTLSQTFVNQNNEPINGSYRFALPPNAAVSGMRLAIGERILEGEIREKRTAERTFNEAKQQGKRASLVSHSESNLFTTRIANFLPGETLTVSIDYQEVLKPRDGRLELRIPTAQTPRYGASVANEPTVKDMAPFRDADGFGSQVSTATKLARVASAKLALNASIQGFTLGQIDSPSHSLCDQRFREGGWQLSLCPEATADRDMVLSWSVNEGSSAVADFLVQRGYSYPASAQIEVSHGLLAFMPPQPAMAARLPRELILVIDTSGSMAGDSMYQARSALLHALGGLRPEDSFNIIAFSNQARPLWSVARPASAVNLGMAQQFVRGLEADGGTEMAQALELALDGREADESGRLRQVLFITDGAVNGEDELFALIERRLGHSRLFPVAIGSAPNGYFMSRAAMAGRGSFTFIGHGGEVNDKMSSLLGRIEHPVISDLTVTWQDGREVTGFPQKLSDLYAGEALMLSLKATPGELMPVIVRGNTDGQPWERTLSPRPVPAASGLDLTYAKARVDALGAQAMSSDERRDATAALGLEYHLVTAHTSLVAVDKTPVTDGNARHVRLEEATPLGWQGGRLPQTATSSIGLLLAGVLCLLLAFLGTVGGIGRASLFGRSRGAI
ncbi:marine proteobacterial sortase target protein [Shewanella sp.]|uniref:marine proteobacterial sortase target protein n=1 Tax=Shewanella sp. TaxID=50422 RepID=UPI00356578CE